MKPSQYAFRSATDDGLVINDATRHQYYSTMQAEVYNEDLLDEALNRRQAKVLMKREQKGRLGLWLAAAAVGAVLALVFW